jgi:hypothetical protein
MIHKCEAVSCVANQKLEFKDSATTEWPHSWAEGELSYRLNNFSADTKDKWQIQAVTDSLMAWQWKIKKIRFRRERNPTAHVDLNYSFKSVDSFSSANVLAHDWYPGQGEASGDCEINDNWDWVPGVWTSDMGHPPLIPILIHETGHGLGLVHATDYPAHKDDIMYPSFDLGKKKNEIGSYSIGRIQSRYGARSINQKVEDMLLLRRYSGIRYK